MTEMRSTFGHAAFKLESESRTEYAKIYMHANRNFIMLMYKVHPRWTGTH